MNQATTMQKIRDDNRVYAGTGGISRNNRGMGFQPGFMDAETGRMDIARFASGSPSPIHVLDGVPDEWVRVRSKSGSVASVKGSVVTGFIRAGRFYTRQEVAAICAGSRV